jgi:hypothetical protein
MRTQEQIQESLNELKVCMCVERVRKEGHHQPKFAAVVCGTERAHLKVHGRGSSLDEMLDNFRI